MPVSLPIERSLLWLRWSRDPEKNDLLNKKKWYDWYEMFINIINDKTVFRKHDADQEKMASISNG